MGAPVVREYLKDADFTIMCKVGGYPRPTITLTKDGKMIKEDSIITRKTADSTKLELKISKSAVKDSGYYRCTATNDKETVEKKIVISVSKLFVIFNLLS